MADVGDAADLDARRARMVADQLERRGIADRRVLEAMARVPRHRFVPAHLQSFAYDDRALEIGEGQTISQPFMVAIMTEMLGLRAAARVLEIGTGSGYQAAVLAEIAREVVTIERKPELAARARRTIDSLGYTNVRVVVGDGTLGYASCAPYDGIVVTAAAPRVPPTLKLQIADAGRLIVPVGPRFSQELRVIARRASTFDEYRRELCVFVPLIGEEGWPDSR